MRLAEVGELGQQRIQSSRLSVGRSPSAEIEVMYLERAGVESLRLGDAMVGDAMVGDAMVGVFEHQRAFRHAAPHAFGAAAWRALQKLRGILEV
jgi:hypothetical protein